MESKVVWISFPSARKAFAIPLVDLEYFSEQTASELADEEISRLPNWAEGLFDLQDSFEAGNFLALFEGLRLCNEAQIPLPVWLKEELEKLVISQITGESYLKRGRGRSSDKFGKMLEAFKRHIRKDAVERVRRYQMMRPCLLAFFLLPPGLKKIYSGKSLPDLGDTVEDAIDYADLSLRGTFAQASRETIRKAYFSEDDGSWLELHFVPQALKELGIDEPENQFLPKGYTWVNNGVPVPFHLSEGRSLPMGPISEEYLSEMSGYPDVDAFFEALKRRSAK